MRIVMGTEDPFTAGAAVGNRPLGGAETAFALLAEAFERRGHAVEVCAEGRASTAPAGMVLASRLPRVFRRLPRRGRRVLWLHNPCGYLRKPRHLLPLLAARPRVVTLGPSHSAGLPRWLPFRPVEIPLAVAPPFSDRAPRRAPPPPVAVFASNPLRSLDWLLDLWTARVRPAVPAAELHLYTGAATYGGDARLAARAAPVLARAASLAGAGVRLRDPMPRPALAERLGAARAMLYRGDPGETFCLALAEAQAIGLPCVVTPLGAVAERVVDGETGVVAWSDDAFAEAAVRLLSDDAAWSAMHAAALARGPGPDWDSVAARFEALAA
ncbi:glycosyltransferase [Craurococcus roseus]|uniref:Glycosyltransferase n=2 Tax=Craurococcus roseus TaxID=77585 RepID=A0ABN1F3Z9_9PROT